MRALEVEPDLLLVNATDRDHRRRAGLALHLGALLDLPTVGVTHRAFADRGRPSRFRERSVLQPLERSRVTVMIARLLKKLRSLFRK